MKATLNLRKADLITQLEARKVELVGKFDAKRAEIQEVIDHRATAGGDAEAHAAYYEVLAEGLKDGSITVTPGTGKLKGAPPKPGTKAYTGTVKTRRMRHTDWNYYSDEQLEQHKKHYDEGQAAEIKPVQTAIDLLNLATDEVVEIDTTDYHNLLNGGHSRW